MTVVLVDSIQSWIGVAADTKPTAPPAGSVFYETDTGITSVYNGTAWRVKPSLTPFKATKTVTFTGAANLGAVGAVPYFTVTGEVLVEKLVPICTVNLGEAAINSTIALGVTGSTSLLIAATDAVPTITAGLFWVDTAPDANGVAIPAALKDIAITDNIIATVAVQNVNAGAIRIDLLWRPLSADGLVVAA